MTTIRDAEPRDLEATLAIYNDAVLHTTAVYDYVERAPEAHRAWFEAKRTGNLPVFVASEGGAVVAFASYGPFRPWPGYLHTVENSIYVAAASRGRGFGKELLQALIDDASQRGYHAMVAGIDATNAASLRLHEGCGFERVGCFREVGWKFDRWLDLVFLQRMLSASRTGASRP